MTPIAAAPPQSNRLHDLGQLPHKAVFKSRPQHVESSNNTSGQNPDPGSETNQQAQRKNTMHSPAPGALQDLSNHDPARLSRNAIGKGSKPPMDQPGQRSTFSGAKPSHQTSGIARSSGRGSRRADEPGGGPQVPDSIFDEMAAEAAAASRPTKPHLQHGTIQTKGKPLSSSLS